MSEAVLDSSDQPLDSWVPLHDHSYTTQVEKSPH